MGSTGRICGELAEEFEQQGHKVKIAYGRGNVPEKYQKYAVQIGNNIDVKTHVIRTRVLDEHGFGSQNATRKFLTWAEEYKPDMLWLHNIHGYYINVEMLFEWIKCHPEMQVKWTLHDCWAFTGHCSHFSMVKCNQWKTACINCSHKKLYPMSWCKDNSKKNFERKRKAFIGVKKMTLITPSEWLAALVKQSFLQEYPIEVIYNQIDRNVFKPRVGDFREKYGLIDKKMILGVASVWAKSKGLDDFIQLAKMLNEKYVIVLVGLSEKQIKKLPKGMIGISRTDNAEALAEIYTAADIFVNPSREETFGLTTVEALACGTKAIVYENTACEEIAKKYGGIVVREGVKNIYDEIVKIQ